MSRDGVPTPGPCKGGNHGRDKESVITLQSTQAGVSVQSVWGSEQTVACGPKRGGGGVYWPLANPGWPMHQPNDPPPPRTSARVCSGQPKQRHTQEHLSFCGNHSQFSTTKAPPPPPKAGPPPGRGKWPKLGQTSSVPRLGGGGGFRLSIRGAASPSKPRSIGVLRLSCTFYEKHSVNDGMRAM